MGRLTNRYIFVGFVVGIISGLAVLLLVLHSSHVRQEAVRDLEEFTGSLGGKFNTDLQDGGSWVYLDGLHLTETQAHQFSAIAQKRTYGIGPLGVVPIYLSLCNTRCDLPISELVTEHVWYCSLDGQRLTLQEIQQIVDIAPNLSRISLAATNVDDEMLSPLKYVRLNSLDVRGTRVTAEGLCRLFSKTESQPIVYSDFSPREKAVLNECGLTCF